MQIITIVLSLIVSVIIAFAVSFTVVTIYTAFNRREHPKYHFSSSAEVRERPKNISVDTTPPGSSVDNNSALAEWERTQVKK